jgi:hypothetical protein
MTEHDLDHRLRSAANRLSETVDPTADASALSHRQRDRQRRRAAGIGGVAIILVGLATAVALSIGDASTSRVDTADGTRSTDRTTSSRPTGQPSAATPLRLWLTETTVPRDGRTIGVAVVNDTDQPELFGVGAGLQRWQNGGWEPTNRAVTLCVQAWQCLGEVHDGPTAGVRLIGLEAHPSSVGPLLLLHLGPLEPGRYRLIQAASSGATATASFDVAPNGSGSVAASPLDDVIGHQLQIDPAVLTSGDQDVTVHTMPATINGASPPTPPAGAPVEIERWSGTGWRHAAESTLRSTSEPGSFSLRPPLLSPGAYRLTVRDGATRLVGYLWIE